MKLEEKIGQLFVVPANDDTARHVAQNRVGGVIWFASAVREAIEKTKQWQSLANIPLIVSADLESGTGMRFPEVTWWPPAMAIAATGNVDYAREMGRITAIESQAIGINHVLAPVCDVNVDPDNPVINTRSFGDDPHEVAKYVAAFVEGVQSEGSLACAKHFPGHGDTHTDSHRALPVLDVDRERLERVELVPFRAAIKAGVGSVMMGHLSVPALDATPAPVRGSFENPYGTQQTEVPRHATLPATVSAEIIGMLRREFDGLIVTDAFDMGGLAAHFDAGEAAVRAIEAGEDQILFSADTDAAIAAVLRAVRTGRIRESRIDESLERILATKKRYAVRPRPLEVIDAREHRAVAEEIAAKAITLVRDERGLLPLRGRIAAVAVKEHEEDSLDEALRTLNATHRPEEADVIVLLIAARAKSGAGRITVPEEAQRIARRYGGKTVAISYGTPYIHAALPEIGTFVNAFGIQPLLQRAAVRAIQTGRFHTLPRRS